MPEADDARHLPAPFPPAPSRADTSRWIPRARDTSASDSSGDGQANEPLALSPAMHTVLASAVHSLLKDSRLAGRSDLVKLAAVVLLAKAPAGSAVVDMASRDVGGWLGCSLSHVGHTAVPGLKATDAVLCKPKRTDEGQTEGLRLELLPLRRARAAADGRPLAMLNKRELATLLRFCEAVTCPGWSPPGRAATPPGFMAQRRGRGAPTDRLAMLLLSLEARRDGRVRMAPGRVPRGGAAGRHDGGPAPRLFGRRCGRGRGPPGGCRSPGAAGHGAAWSRSAAGAGCGGRACSGSESGGSRRRR